LLLKQKFSHLTGVLQALIKQSKGKQWCLAGLWLVVAGFCAPSAFAAGTPAGTQIPNSATLSFTVNGQPASLTAVAPVVVVAEVINVLLTWQDASALPVNSPDIGRPLRFLLTNTGNGSESFSLLRDNAITGDQFDPANAAIGAIYLESGAQPGFQPSGPNADILYLPGVNDPVLAADASRAVYVISDIPAALANGALGIVGLRAASTTPGAAGAFPGTSLTGLGQGGVDAVIGGSRAISATNGSYINSGLAVMVAKTVASVVDPRGGNLVMPGSLMTYHLVLTVSGNGVAQNLSFSDPLPASTSYVPGSISVGGSARSDAVDADNASFTPPAGLVPASVNVVFGNTSAPATLVIEFKVTVN
jgi:uncharacterized repeat protein (TIGR01451 family)